MANKSIFALLLLLTISATIAWPRKQIYKISLGSGNLRSSGWFGKKQDFYYHNIPRETVYVSLDYNDHSSNGMSVGSGNGKATLSWTRGSSTAKVHAWVNGKFKGGNHVAWTVWAWLLL